MTTKRGKLIAAALALVLVVALAFLIFYTPHSDVSANSVDKRLKIYDVRYFPERYDYAFFPTGAQWFQYQWQRLLTKLSSKALPPVAPINQRGVGPALLICGELKDADTPFLDLVTDKGEAMLPPKRFGGPRTDYPMNRFLWRFAVFDPKSFPSNGPITNGTYRLRNFGETNDLAIIRVRLKQQNQ